jgi:hypothetical protein
MVPGQISYQGYLVDAADSSAVTGTEAMTFRLFDSETAGSELWSEVHSAVEIVNGLFYVMLGSVTPFPVGLFDGSTIWLQMEVGSDVFAPRKPLASVPYSYRANSAEMLLDYTLTDLDDRWVNEGQANSITDDMITGTVWTAGNDGASSGLDADMVDGQHGADFISMGDLDHLDASDGDPANAVYIDDAGQVGIGKTAPGFALDVNGQVNANAYYGDGSNLTGIGGTTDNDWTVSGSDLYSSVSGNVGIGTASPAHKLHVEGDVSANLYEIAGNTVLSTPGTDNVFLGVDAGELNTGSFGSFVGSRAGQNNQSDLNTFIGAEAGRANTTGAANTFLGAAAGQENTEGSGNTFLGWQAGQFNTTSIGNVFLGSYAGWSHQAGDGNTFLGTEAGLGGNTGEHNVCVGYQAGAANQSDMNTLVGAEAGLSNTIGTANTFLGAAAGRENTEGGGNTFLGWRAGQFNTTSLGNVFLGSYAGWSHQAGDGNTFLGTEAGLGGNTGEHNVSVGYQAGAANQSDMNTFVGAQAGLSNTAGTANTFLGAAAGQENTEGVGNTFLGWRAGQFNTTSVGNAFLGSYTGWSHETGDGNTFLGTEAGLSNNNGVGNVFVGYQSGYHETGSNRLYIANASDTSAVLVFGNFSTGSVGLGTLSPAEKLHLNKSSGSLGIRISSDVSSYQYINFGAANGYGIGCDDTDKFFINREQPLGTGFLRAVTIQSDGNVGVGTKTPGYKLDVAGQAHATSFPTSSDRRLKRNIQPLHDVLKKLERINGVSFEWNQLYDSFGRSTGRREIGVIAQEIGAEFPELVSTWGDDDYQAVDYGRLTGVLIEAIKELNEGLEELQEENRYLRQRIESLEEVTQ